MANKKSTAKSNRPSDSLAANDTEDSVKEDGSGAEANRESVKVSKKSVGATQTEDDKTEEKLIDTSRSSRKRPLSQMTGGEIVEVSSKKQSKKLKLSDAYATWKKSLAKTSSQDFKTE